MAANDKLSLAQQLAVGLWRPHCSPPRLADIEAACLTQLVSQHYAVPPAEPVAHSLFPPAPPGV